MEPGKQWVCVQSVVPGEPKLVRIDASDKVAKVIAFGEAIAPRGSYLNDVRFSPGGLHAYITDSGAQGALVIVELASGKAKGGATAPPSPSLSP